MHLKAPLEFSVQSSGPRGRGFKSRHSDQKSPDFTGNQEIFLVICSNIFAGILRPFPLTQTRPIRENFEKVPGAGSGTSSFFFWILLRLLGDEATHPLGGVPLHLPGDVGVGVQREACAVVAQDAGDCLGVHSLLDRQRGEGVSQPVEGDVFGDSCPFQKVLCSRPRQSGP